MKIFGCGKWSNPLFFENVSCEKCGHYCGFLVSDLTMLTFESTDAPMISDRKKKSYKYCKNQEFGICNWLIPIEHEDEFCEACALNRTIPDLTDDENFKKWQKRGFLITLY
jgi:hypothetical protein